MVLRHISWARGCALMVSVGLLVGCSPSPGTPNGGLPQKGLIKLVQAFGEYYESEVGDVKNGMVVWKTHWGDQLVSERKSYLNLFDVAVVEADEKVVNEFDTAVLDAFFPLEIGKETSFSGIKRWRSSGRSMPFQARLFVRGEDALKVQGEYHPVFIIDMSVDIEARSGESTATSTFWRCKTHGLNLMVNIDYNRRLFKSRVVKIRTPDDNSQQNTVGTTLIRFDPPAARPLGQTVAVRD